MFCTNCGAQVPDTQPFCTKCGAALPAAGEQASQAPQAIQTWQQQGAPSTVTPAYTPAYAPQPNPGGPKKTNPATIVAVIAGIVILVAVAIIAVVLLMPHADSNGESASSSKNDTTTSTGTSVQETVSNTTPIESSSTVSSSTTASSSASTGDSVQDRINSSNGYVLPDSDSRKYTDSELSKLDVHTLFLARNEIYARHGRKFVSEELQRYFNGKDWYRGTIEPNDFSDNSLNDIERANTQAMLAIEKSRNSPYV